MSLTTTAKNVKIGFVIFVAFIIVYLLGASLFVPALKGVYRAIFPPKNPPNPVYGRLEPLEFEPQRILNTSQPKYTLFTSNGKLPGDLPKRMTVYKYSGSAFSYQAGKDATDTAQILGFSQEDLATSLKGDIYKWVEPTTGANLEINIGTKEINLKTPNSSLVNVYKEGSMNRTVASTLAKEYLRNIGRFSDPLYLKGSQTVDLGTIENRKIEYTSYAGEAEIGYVNFFRSIEDFPIVGPKYDTGLIRIQVGKRKNERDEVRKVLNHPYIYYNVKGIRSQSNATYPIIPVTTAWSQIIAGNGVISLVKPNDLSPFEEYTPVRIAEILINDIFLSYYDDTEVQPYLQPIYVFKGNYIGPNNEKGTIAIYYPAVSGEYVKSAQSETN